MCVCTYIYTHTHTHISHLYTHTDEAFQNLLVFLPATEYWPHLLFD